MDHSSCIEAADGSALLRLIIALGTTNVASNIALSLLRVSDFGFSAVDYSDKTLPSDEKIWSLCFQGI